MNIVTVHMTAIAVDNAGRLLQVRPHEAATSDLLKIDDAQGDGVIKSGPLAGFATIKSKGGVQFTKDGRYLCAEQNGKLVADRNVAGEWEHFLLVPDASTARKELWTSVSAEIGRLRAKIATLTASGQPVKLHFGCSDVILPGFLNLDRQIFDLSFYLRHYDDYFTFPYAEMPWGLPDNSVDYIYHEDFIEHLDQLQQVQFLAEAWRVLRPGCYHRINTPNLLTAMRRNSDMKRGFAGVYTGERQWGHLSIFTPSSLKEIAELIGYREVVFTTKSHGVSPFAVADTRPGTDRDPIVGNIYADLQK